MAVMAKMTASDTDDDFADGGDDDEHHNDVDDLRTLRGLIADTKFTNGVAYQHDGGHSAGHQLITFAKHGGCACPLNARS